MIRRLSLVPTVFVLVFIIKASYGHFEDPDFYWHIKTGEYILASRSLPHADIFSYTQAGKPWVLHEWLFQVLLYVVYKLGGTLGVNLLVALFYTTCCYLMFLMVRRLLGGGDGKALIVTLLFASLFTGVAPRPYLFTFLFFAFFLYRLVLFKYCQDRSRLWLFPMAMPFWANLHGGYFIGIFLLCLFLATEWISSLLAGGPESEQKARNRLAMFTLLALVATLLNPEFIRYWLYPFQVIGMDASKGGIEEWRSPDFHQPFFQYFLAVVTGAVGLALYAGKRMSLTEFTIPAVFTLGAIVARRNIPLAGITLAPFVALHLNAALQRLRVDIATVSETGKSRLALLLSRRLDSAMQASDIAPRAESVVNAILIVVTALALVLIYPSRQKEMKEALDTVIPVKATDFIVNNQIQGRMFNAYHYGGYLIYRLYPAQKVFIDGRADMYGDRFIKYANGVYLGDSDWKATFDKYHIDYVICESESPIRQLLLASATFKLVYDDQQHSVLVKNIPRFQAIISKYEGRPAHG